MKFKEYKGLDLAQTAADVLGEWDARDTFHKSITTREGHPAFVFYEGPPSANGTPGIHHVMARTIKDVFCRYKTQQGYLVHRKAGWDTHGLPVELGVEKKLGITKEDIGKKITIEEYNRTCREAVMEFTGMWEDLTRKMGYWVNMDDPYITYDNKYIETLWWLLKQLFDKGLLYKGYTIQPYSPAAGTGLSTHELNQPGCYRDVKDTTCTAQFEVIRDQKSEKLFAGVEGPLYFLAWTTTPWTLPSNTALAVGPAIEYVKVKCRNPYTDRPQTVILAKELVPAYFTKKMEGTYEITGESWQGPELEGIRYEQLIPWVKPMGDAFRVIVGDYVTTSDGTGIVHIAPTFGADDDRVGRAAGIAPLFMVDKAGKNQPMVDRQGKFFLLEELDPEFVKNNVDAAKYREYAGRYVKNAYAKALILSADKNSAYYNETDPKAGHLWGDAAAAFFISKERVSEKDSEIVEVYTQGLGYLGKAPDAVHLRPCDGGIMMPEGRDVFIQACTYMPKNVLYLLEKNGYTLDNLTYFIGHQANMRIMSNIAKQLNLPEEKFLHNIEELGNTGSVSSALVYAHNDHSFKKGDLVAITVFGGGYSTGACLIKC